MGPYLRSWIVILVLSFSLQGYAVLDEVLPSGSGVDIPTVRLTEGEASSIRVNEGETLQSQCYLENEYEDGVYEFSWVSRGTGGLKVLANGPDLNLSSVTAEDFRDPIFCHVEDVKEKQIYEKQIAIEFHGSTQPRSLDIRPMPSENLQEGIIVRKCEVTPTQPLSDIWDYTWSDFKEETISINDILSIEVKGDKPSVTYTCRARNRRNGQQLIGKFTVNTRVITDSITYNTRIETMSPRLEFGRPYEARCMVQPTPSEPVAYTWYFRDRIMSDNERIHLPSFNRDTAGEYVCTARPAYGGFGRAYANATLGLRLKASDDLHTELRLPPGSTLITNVGERRELHCEIYIGDKVTWYFNSSIIYPSANVNRTGHLQRIDYSRVSIMAIDGVEEFHEGQWECRTDTESKIVNVIVVSNYELEVNPLLYDLKEGELMEIHCSTQGAYQILNSELMWFFRPLHSSLMRPLSFENTDFMRNDSEVAKYTSVITKVAVTASDEGEYICREPRGRTGVSTLRIRRLQPHTLHITPGVIKLRPGQDVNLLCYSMELDRRTRGPRPKLRTLDNRLALRITETSDNAISGVVLRIDSSFNGAIIECYSDLPNVEPVRTIIHVEDICSPGYRRCHNGECLQAGRFCDGNLDCADESDEEPALCSICDPIVMNCETYRSQSPRKSTFMVHWQCDGEDDCGNGFDEANCQAPAIDFCVKQQHMCYNSTVQIPRAFMCDSEPDCPRGDDENQCREPQILDAPRGQYAHRQGDTVTLTCEVGGHPNPRVIWRFNWGCLPDDGRRMTVRNYVENCGTPNEKTVSRLTISNFTPGDDGIYNCEGLNGLKRAMSRDYIVILIN